MVSAFVGIVSLQLKHRLFVVLKKVCCSFGRLFCAVLTEFGVSMEVVRLIELS